MPTEQEQKRIDSLLKSGVEPRMVADAIKQSRASQAELNKPEDNIFFGEGSLTSSVGGAVKTAVTQPFMNVKRDIDYYRSIPKDERYAADLIGTIGKAPLSLVAGVGQGLGEGIGGILETADDLTGEVVSDFLRPGVEYLAGTETGQKAIANLERLDEDSRGVSGDILEMLNLVGVAAIAKGGTAQSLKNGFKEAMEQTAKGTIRTTNATVNTAKGGASLPGLRSVFGKTDDVVAPKDISQQAFDKTVKKGITESEAVTLERLVSSKSDKQVANNLIKAVEDIDPNAPRPADIVGANIAAKNKQVFNLLGDFGKKLDETAKNLKGKRITVRDLKAKITEDMSAAGIIRTDKGYNFADSVFSEVPAIQTRLAAVLKKVDGFSGDAFKAHSLKKALDEIIDYGKQAEGLTGNAERFIKGIRKNIDDALDAKFATYRKANERFADVAKVRDQIMESFGKGDKAIDSIKLGGKARTLLSNASVSRANTEAAISQIESILKKYKVKTTGDIRSQSQFLGILETMYGTSATFSLKGQLEGALESAGLVKGVLRDPVGGTGQVLIKAAEKVSGKTPAQQLEYIKTKLNQDTPTPSKTVQSTQVVAKEQPASKVSQTLKDNSSIKRTIDELKSDETLSELLKSVTKDAYKTAADFKKNGPKKLKDALKARGIKEEDFWTVYLIDQNTDGNE